MISSLADVSERGVISSPLLSDILTSSEEIHDKIIKGVVRAKLSKRRHLVLTRTIRSEYLDSLMPSIVSLFQPQLVTYNGGVANIKNWKISCYLEVMDGGVPCTNPHLELRDLCSDLLDTCNYLFAVWYRQQQGGNSFKTARYQVDKDGNPVVIRLMTFITRYTPLPNENALLKHIDGAGKVDGSIVVALPIDRWTADEGVNSFEGNGGGLTFWDGTKSSEGGKRIIEEIKYDTRSGDVAFIDKAVWHQANPITKGTRWALVIFYKVMR